MCVCVCVCVQYNLSVSLIVSHSSNFALAGSTEEYWQRQDAAQAVALVQ